MWKIGLETKMNEQVIWVQIFLPLKQKIVFTSHLIKSNHKSTKEKLSRYLWSTRFAPDYSTTVLAAKMCTNNPHEHSLCRLDFHKWATAFYRHTYPFPYKWPKHQKCLTSSNEEVENWTWRRGFLVKRDNDFLGCLLSPWPRQRLQRSSAHLDQFFVVVL